MIHQFHKRDFLRHFGKELCLSVSEVDVWLKFLVW